MKPYLIAIAGGIGSGKSIVSRILTAMGYEVYDCDSRAKGLMDESDSIKSAIATDICHEAIRNDNTIDRLRLAEVVFADPVRLARLNAIVHGAVRDDIARWRDSRERDILWIESAIIYESGLDKMVDEVWEVTAPIELRVKRVIYRNGLTADEIMRRIEAQSITVVEPHRRIYTILNDDVQPVLPQVENLLSFSRSQ